MADESIIPARNVTPVLRADATDDHLDDVEGEGDSSTRYKFVTGGALPPEGSGIEVGDTAEEVEKKLDAFEVAMVCPICELPQCGHNLQKVMKS